MSYPLSALSPQSFYKEKIARYSSQAAEIRKKLSLVALFRLISFIALAVAVYFLIALFSYPVLIAVLASFGAFAGFIGWNWKLRDRRDLLDKLLSLNDNELRVLNDGPNVFPDGLGFLTHEDYLDDLDIFGKRSLFHVLNRTTTAHGTDKLADQLRHPLQHAPEIVSQQQAIRILSHQPDKRELLIARGLLSGEKKGNLYEMESWLQTLPYFLRKNWISIVRWLIPFFNIAALLLWITTGIYRPLLVGIMAAWILNGYFAKHISKQVELLGQKDAILHQYASILQLFDTMDAGDSALLQQLKTRATNAHRSIRRLASLSSYFDRQLNPMISFWVNNLFLYNLHGIIALEKWKQSNKNNFLEWIDTVGKIEMLNSFAAFAFNNPGYAYPTPQASPNPTPQASPALSICATQLAHPLIPAAERIANDLDIGNNERLMLITGSNMSGKTTFLRTVGVNCLLAQCGAPVCAASFVFTPVHILSSLRISDSLQEHTSYFMAELKRLQQIIHRLQTGQPALVLVDEILRGTNSEDKTFGSEHFIRKLLQYSCLAMFATHDLSLGSMEQDQPSQISNYCFESVIGDGELHFDYRLQRGIARNRNASFLMQKMEII
jgi:hypothetical protein